MYKRISLSIIIILLMGVSFFGGIQYSELKAKEEEEFREIALEDEILSLYNDTQTDLNKNVTKDKLSDLNTRFEAEENKTEASAKLLLDANYMLEFYETIELEPGSDLKELGTTLPAEKIEELSLILEQIENEVFVEEKEAILLSEEVESDNDTDLVDVDIDNDTGNVLTNKEFETAAEAVKWAKANMDSGENWSEKGFTSWTTKPIAEKDDKGKTIRKVYEIEFKKEE